MKDFNIEDFINDYNEAQMVVIGIGSQLTSDKYGEISAMNEIITFFNNYLDKRIILLLQQIKKIFLKIQKLILKEYVLHLLTMKKTDRNSGIYIINGCRQH